MAEELRLVLTPPVLKILVDGTNVLWDPTTSEQVVLGKGKFVVERDSAVEPSYVYDENDEDSMPKWVPDLFYFKVYRNSNGDLFIQDSLERSRASLKEFQCASRSIKVHIALPGSCTPSAFMVWHNKGATTGCHAWWICLTSLLQPLFPMAEEGLARRGGRLCKTGGQLGATWQGGCTFLSQSSPAGCSIPKIPHHSWRGVRSKGGTHIPLPPLPQCSASWCS